MPTSRPRHMITETNTLSDGLRLAEKEWPDFAGNRAALIRQLISRGIESVVADNQKRASRRIGSVEAISRSMNGVWPDNWREKQLGDWPE